MCVYICVNECSVCGSPWSEKKATDPWELELKVVVSWPTSVLGTALAQVLWRSSKSSICQGRIILGVSRSESQQGQ